MSSGWAPPGTAEFFAAALACRGRRQAPYDELVGCSLHALATADNAQAGADITTPPDQSTTRAIGNRLCPALEVTPSARGIVASAASLVGWLAVRRRAGGLAASPGLGHQRWCAAADALAR